MMEDDVRKINGKDSLLNFLSSQERVFTSLAENREPDEYWQEFKRLANEGGGIIVLGAKLEDGNVEVRGVDDPRKIEHRITLPILSLMDKAKCPFKESNVMALRINGKSVIIVIVPSFEMNISIDVLKSFFSIFLKGKEPGREKKPTKSETLSGYTFSDLDARSISLYRERVISRYPFKSLRNMDDEEFLFSLGIIGKGDGDYLMTRASILLFGTQYAIKREFPSFSCTMRKGKITLIGKDENANLFMSFFNAEAFIKCAFLLKDESEILKEKRYSTLAPASILSSLLLSNGSMPLEIDDSDLYLRVMGCVRTTDGMAHEAVRLIGHADAIIMDAISEACDRNSIRKPLIKDDKIVFFKKGLKETFGPLDSHESYVVDCILSGKNKIKHYRKLTEHEQRVTVKRLLDRGLLLQSGKARATAYSISPDYYYGVNE